MGYDIGTSATVTFVTSAFTASCRSINGQAIDRVMVDSTHLGTTSWRTFVEGDLAEPGQITMSILFDPASQPPISAAAETIRVTFPLQTGQSTATKLESSGFVTEWSFGVPLEDLMTADLTIQLTGSPTWTDST